MQYVILKILAISIAIPAAIALGLILSQPAGGDLGQGGLDFSNQIAKGTVRSAPERRIAMRDGFEMSVWDYPAHHDGAPLLVLVHGSGWHSLQLDGLAEALRDVAHVVTPDLRGHGANPGRRGDVDYIGQLEDDLADLIAAMRADGQKVVLAGHSSGGGLVVRFAGGAHGAGLDAAVLLAPFLKYNAPTTRPDSGGWAVPLTRRIIGLSMLNGVRIRALNGLTAIRFRVPAEVLNGPLGNTATGAYSFRMNTSFAPRGDYLKDVAALPPFLLIAGHEDEAFVADQYQPTMAAVTARGSYLLVEGVGHLDIVDAPETVAAMAAFLKGLARQ
ncbi:MAG: alpha/beta fold hydrolase [Rhodobacteraceae bacterium]|nr:alpha/beta fold hydrolase [Paracoccaceae bacterium]